MLYKPMLRLRFLTSRKTQPANEEGYALINQQKISYTLHRKAGKRRITLYVEPSGNLRLVAPLRAKPFSIDRFLAHSQNWVKNKLNDLQKYPSPHFPRKLEQGATLYYLGTPHQLTLTQNADAPQTCWVKGAKLEVNLPNSSHTSAAELQEEIRLEIMLWYKKQARQILKERSEFWAAQMGSKYRSLKITSPTRQWGSCSARNDIRLNWRVMMAAPEVIDYLIVHELAHITHKNHSSRFWNCVGQFIPDYKARQQVLKRMDAGFSV